MLRNVDEQKLAVGAICATVASLGLGLLLAGYAERNEESGATADVLEQAFYFLLGAGAGLLVGSAVAAALARTGSRILTGVLAGLLAYAAILAPIYVLTSPEGVTTSEAFVTTLLLLIPASAFTVLGSLIGRLVRTIVPRRNTTPPR